MVKQNVTVTGPGVLAASQLLDLQLEIEAVAPQQLRVLPGELVVDVGRGDLLTLHRVHGLQHLEADLVDEALGVLGQKHDLLEVQGVAKAPHGLSRLEAAVADAQLAHLVHDGLALEIVDLLTLVEAEPPDAAGVGALGQAGVIAALLQGPRGCAQLVQPRPQVLEAGVEAVGGHVEILRAPGPSLGRLNRNLVVAEDLRLGPERCHGGVPVHVDREDGLARWGVGARHGRGQRGGGEVGGELDVTSILERIRCSVPTKVKVSHDHLWSR